VIVGFAAETGDADGSVLEHGRRKLRAKGCDILVVNDVSGVEGFGSGSNTVTVLTANGSQEAFPSMSKSAVADAVLDAVAGQFTRG
jgi:phosphopantothenoylcysteine decarboxylase/phosphopantothenate--cysteine ligase